MRILLVDDDALLGRSMMRALRSDRHELVWDADPSVALERIAHGERFDLVLCDVNMPHIDGVAFVGHAMESDPGLVGRMVAITGGTTRSTEEALAQRGIGVLEKPFDAATLEALIGGFASRA